MVDRFSGFAMVGVPFVAIKYKAFSGFWFRYGGSPSIISERHIKGTSRQSVRVPDVKAKMLTDRHDSQGPDIDLVSVFLPGYDLRSHPVGSSNHGCAFGVTLGDLCTEPEVG